MSKINRPVLVCAALLACWTGLAATASAGRPKPATRPAARAEADRSTPRAGLRAFITATEAMDTEAAAACFHVSNKQERLLAQSLAMLGTSQMQLKRAARIRLGEPAVRELCGHILRAADVEQLRAEEQGDTAVVYVTATDGFAMVKVDGKWLVSASATAAREKHEPIVLATVYLEFATRHSVAAKGVIQGRYRSVEKISKFLEDGKPIEETAATE